MTDNIFYHLGYISYDYYLDICGGISCWVSRNDTQPLQHPEDEINFINHINWLTLLSAGGVQKTRQHFTL